MSNKQYRPMVSDRIPLIDVFFCNHALNMLLFILLSTLFNIPLSNTENEDFQRVCAGRDFRLPVYSASRIVTFTPNYPPGPRRVLLDKNDVKDPRFEWTRDRTLLLREVTHSDQGLYSIKLPSGFTYETVRLTVSDCIKSVRRGYGETFQYSIPKEGSLLEFVPRGSPPETLPVILWNQSDTESAVGSRGRVQQDGRIWVAEMVTQADQGNYTVRDGNGKILSRSTLAVHGHTFNVTHFPKESLNIPLFLPLPYAHLIFTPTPHHDDPPVSTFDLYPPRGPMQLIRDGQIVEQDARYRSLISVSRNGGVNEVVISRLSSRHDGVYEVRDREGNLVSSTSLHVIDKTARWRAVLKSITVPSGLFVTLAGFILFMKRFPSCGVAQIINGLRAHHPQATNPPHINVQDFSAPSPQHSGLNNQSELPRTPTKWSSAPVRSGYSPVLDREPRSSPGLSGTGGQVAGRQKDETSTNNMLSAEDPDSRKRRTSISVPGASDCLRSSEDCARFHLKKEGKKERWSKADDFFSTLPLDTDTLGTCSVYTSDKLDFS